MFRPRRQEGVSLENMAVDDSRVQGTMAFAREAIQEFVRLLPGGGIAERLVVHCEQQVAVRRLWALILAKEDVDWWTAMGTMGYVPLVGMSAGWRTFEGWSKRVNGLELNLRSPMDHGGKDSRMMPASSSRNVDPGWLRSAIRWTR